MSVPEFEKKSFISALLDPTMLSPQMWMVDIP
jgi:hypothetical protein